MKKHIAAVKMHFDRHRFAYGVITASIILGYLASKRADEWNAFLEKHDLLDEYYMPETYFTVGAPE